MRRIEREIYGFGPRLSTKHDRMFVVAVVLMATVLGSMLGALLW